MAATKSSVRNQARIPQRVWVAAMGRSYGFRRTLTG